jgi:hypothetical protein
MSSRMAALSARHRVEHPRSSRTLLSEHFYRPGNDCCDREYSTFDRGYRRLTAAAVKAGVTGKLHQSRSQSQARGPERRHRGGPFLVGVDASGQHFISSRISTARRPLGFIVQATRRLTVLCDDLPFPQFDLPVDHFEQTALELRRGDPTQDAPESVLLGESKGQFQKLLHPFRFGLTVSLHISGGPSAPVMTEHRLMTTMSS